MILGCLFITEAFVASDNALLFSLKISSQITNTRTTRASSHAHTHVTLYSKNSNVEKNYSIVILTGNLQIFSHIRSCRRVQDAAMAADLHRRFAAGELYTPHEAQLHAVHCSCTAITQGRRNTPVSRHRWPP